MGGKTDLDIKFSSTEQGEESKTTLKMKSHWVYKPFRQQLANKRIHSSRTVENNLVIGIRTIARMDTIPNGHHPETNLVIWLTLNYRYYNFNFIVKDQTFFLLNYKSV